ncbi:hypothetical protein INT43_005049 [Umbelopsis isabellina]|uniref:Flavodoxin-like domain-containing protein n=1 Tax=Mortierella isabellina TaxID=91625 RepID=A0A8H7U7A3_MORIS|nr:hypothetical protein INT43_005049 [Umbelopsis isabellina]
MQKPNAYDTATFKPHEDTNSILDLLEDVVVNDHTYLDEEAQDLVELGDEYSLQKDYKQAKFWWKKAASKGSAKAHLRLAYYHRSVEWNYQKSVQSFKAAAKGENVQAQCHVGELCYDSNNYKGAIKWFTRAAERGSTSAQRKLGYMYYTGTGVKKNLEFAAEWYHKSASEDNITKHDPRKFHAPSGKKSESEEQAARKLTMTTTTASILIYIVYYSVSDHIYTVAKEVQTGLESQGAKVKMFQIPDNFASDILPLNVLPWKNVPNITVDKLKKADGILWGIPIRFGSMPVQVKAFLDDTSRLLSSRALSGKFTGIFFSSSSRQDGQETTAFAALANFYRHGMLYVPLGFSFARTFDQTEVANGFVYGAETVNDKNTAFKPTKDELEIARKQGINLLKSSKLIVTAQNGKNRIRGKSLPQKSRTPIAMVPPKQISKDLCERLDQWRLPLAIRRLCVLYTESYIDYISYIETVLPLYSH